MLPKWLFCNQKLCIFSTQIHKRFLYVIMSFRFIPFDLSSRHLPTWMCKNWSNSDFSEADGADGAAPTYSYSISAQALNGTDNPSEIHLTIHDESMMNSVIYYKKLQCSSRTNFWNLTDIWRSTWNATGRAPKCVLLLYPTISYILQLACRRLADPPIVLKVSLPH